MTMTQYSLLMLKVQLNTNRCCSPEAATTVGVFGNGNFLVLNARFLPNLAW